MKVDQTSIMQVNPNGLLNPRGIILDMLKGMRYSDAGIKRIEDKLETNGLVCKIIEVEKGVTHDTVKEEFFIISIINDELVRVEQCSTLKILWKDDQIIT